MKYRTGGYSLICTSGKVEFQEGFRREISLQKIGKFWGFMIESTRIPGGSTSKRKRYLQHRGYNYFFGKFRYLEKQIIL